MLDVWPDVRRREKSGRNTGSAILRGAEKFGGRAAEVERSTELQGSHGCEM